VVLVRVWLAAAPRARAYALPSLIEGFAAEVEADEVLLTGLWPAVRGEVPLTARPTGQTYRGLPLWEADVRLCWCGAPVGRPPGHLVSTCLAGKMHDPSAAVHP